MSQKSIAHLSQRERYLIEIKLKEKRSIKEISESLNRHRCTVYREIKRNAISRESYESFRAETEYGKRKFEKIKKLKTKRKLNKDEKLFNEIKKLLKNYSPLIISEKYLKGKINYVTIYNHLYYLASLGGKEYKLLYNKHKNRKKQGENRDKKLKIVGRVSIHQRPKKVERKERIGDYELDLICGSDSYLVSLTERKTRHSFLKKLETKQSEKVSDAVVELLKDYKVKTITTDNGLEFAKHEKIASELGCKVYFCDPYSSWQKGIVENFNKLVRKYLPKGTCFNTISNDKIKSIQDTINNYPRKILNFKSAFEVFQQNMSL